MRIALVHMRHAETGGTERFLNHTAAYLAERGHAVTIVCRSHAAAPHPAVRFEVFRRPCVGKTWRMWAFARDVERRLADRDAFDVVYGLGRTWSQDAVRLGGGCYASYLELAHRFHRRNAGLKRLLPGGLRSRVVLEIERRALTAGAYRRVVTNSRMVAEDVTRRHGVPPEAIEVIHNGVDLERFHPRNGYRADGPGAALRRELGLDPDRRVLLFLGTGYARKGLDLVLNAFPPLARELPEAELLVVGYDSALPRYEALARRLGIAGRTHLLGGRRDVEACYGAADLYVLPTRFDPFANATVEALASGLPVITSTTNGGAEVIDAGVQGEALDVIDPWLAIDRLTGMLRAWFDPERLAAGALAARSRAEEHGIETKLARTETLLAGLAASPAQA